MRLDKPIGTMLLLWPSLIALVLASGGNPSIYLFAVFCMGTLIMRSAGCVINDWFDRDIDSKVLRTHTRPLADGRVSSNEALMLFSLLLSLALILLFQLNLLSFYVACLIVVLIVFYPLGKRYLKIPQIILGITFSGGIPLAFAAASNSLPSTCFILMLANFFWILSYDTSYAISDKQDDLALGLGSSAIYFEGKEKITIFTFGLLGLITFGSLGLIYEYNFLFYVIFFVTIIGYFLFFIRTSFSSPSSSFNFFKKNNLIGFLMFVAFYISELIL